LDKKFSQNPHNRAKLIHLFGELDEDLLTQILENGKAVHRDAGDFLFHQGDTDNSFYIVLSGRFRALAKQEDGALLTWERSMP